MPPAAAAVSVVIAEGAAAVAAAAEVALATVVVAEAVVVEVEVAVLLVAAVEEEVDVEEGEHEVAQFMFKILIRRSAGGAKGGAKVIVEPHRHAGVFVGRGKEDLLLTKNFTPGEHNCT